MSSGEPMNANCKRLWALQETIRLVKFAAVMSVFEKLISTFGKFFPGISVMIGFLLEVKTSAIKRQNIVRIFLNGTRELTVEVMSLGADAVGDGVLDGREDAHCDYG